MGIWENLGMGGYRGFSRPAARLLQQAVQLSYNEALTPVYLLLAPMLASCVVLMVLCKSKPLSATQD